MGEGESGGRLTRAVTQGLGSAPAELPEHQAGIATALRHPSLCKSPGSPRIDWTSSYQKRSDLAAQAYAPIAGLARAAEPDRRGNRRPAPVGLGLFLHAEIQAGASHCFSLMRRFDQLRVEQMADQAVGLCVAGESGCFRG